MKVSDRRQVFSDIAFQYREVETTFDKFFFPIN